MIEQTCYAPFRSPQRFSVPSENFLAANKIVIRIHTEPLFRPRKWGDHPYAARYEGHANARSISPGASARAHRISRLSRTCGVLLVGDDEEDAAHLPSGAFDLPLVIQDRTFDSRNQLVYLQNRMERMMGFMGERVLVNAKPDYSQPVE